MSHGIDVCEFCENIVKQCRCIGPHERIKRGVCAQCLAKGRRPMTQAEKDAEAGKADEPLADIVVDGYGMDGMPASIKIDEAEIRRVIEIVRAHDAKQKAGE